MEPLASIARKLFFSEKSRDEWFASSSSSSLYANPRRLAENVPGVVYVNNKCINCASCSNFCPESFARSGSDQNHFVYHQPETPLEIENARAALVACPVAAIRLETKSGKRHATAFASGRSDIQVDWTDQEQELVDKMTLRNAASPFPRPFLNNISGVFWVGHHNDASFGATPYILQARYGGKPIWIMVDVPRHGKSAVEDVQSLCPDGPDFMMLTHVDDTAHHDKWARQFPNMKRILHATELKNNWRRDYELEHCEILLQGETRMNGDFAAFRLDGTPLGENWQEEHQGDNVVILHTPGHSPGSITLYKRPGSEAGDVGILFTGDTYAYTTSQGGYMSGFPPYCRNEEQQVNTIQKFLALEWDVIAPGHGHPRDYRTINDGDRKSLKSEEMQVALEELVGRSNRRLW